MVKIVMKQKMPRLMITVVVTGLVITCILVLIVMSMKRAPEFYRQSLCTPDEQSEAEGRLFERRLVELSNQIRFQESWSSVWTESQINGWLAADLANKFPNVLPDSIIQPRISVEENEIHLAFQVQSKRFNGIIEIRAEVFATQVENQIGFRIVKVRSGLVPVPISWWAGRLEESLRSRDVVLEWTELENSLVALITLPSQFSDGHDRHTILDAVQLTKQGIGLSGRTIHLSSGNPASAPENVTGSNDKVQR